jgi:hypothetical protein
LLSLHRKGDDEQDLLGDVEVELNLKIQHISNMPGQDSAPQCQRTVIIVFGTLFMKYPENFDFLCQFQDAATVLAKSDSGGAGYASVQKVGSRRRSTTSGNKPNTRSASAKSALRKEDKVDAEELELKVK